jgi:hypothetical protein
MMTTAAKKDLYNLMDMIGEKLDITDTQFKKAKDRYEAVGQWLVDGEYCLVGKQICLKDGDIYPQGSLKLETAVKPLAQEEFDVDLVFFTPNVSTNDIEPSELNRLLGDRLRLHSKYKDMMEPLKRGWRITYADEFHLDITPSINNHTEPHNASELVPDRKIQNWKPSNPKEYADWFDDAAKVIPSFSLRKIALESKATTITDFPENTRKKPLLKRYVQLMKRHRDVMFKDKEQKPISIIITTLATHAYAYCVRNFTYDNEFDLLTDTLKHMPTFIEGDEGNYRVMNPKTTYENFAERWNEVPLKKKTFDKWHEGATKFCEELKNSTSGQHQIFESLETHFGKFPVKNVYDETTKKVDDYRKKGLLGAGFGTLAEPHSVKKNTFFGK